MANHANEYKERTVSMLLTDEEKRMIAGDYGPGIQRAMDLLIKLGDSFDAEKLVPISYYGQGVERW